MSGKKQRGLLSGAKFSNKHSTVIVGAEPVVAALRAHPDVSKVVLSVVKHVGPGREGVKVSPIDAGLRVRVRGRTAVQDFYVYTSNPDEVASLVESQRRG